MKTVLLHGLGQTAQDWKEVVQQLSISDVDCPELFSSAEENCPTENVASLCSVKGATLPCAAYAAIPCVLAVRKQHEMLFAASKFESKQILI